MKWKKTAVTIVCMITWINLAKNTSYALWQSENGSYMNQSVDSLSNELNTLYDNQLIADSSWNTSEASSKLVFLDHTNFIWHKNLSLDSYTTGIYQLYQGDAAAEYLVAGFKIYGVTKEDLIEVFSQNGKYTLENFVYLITNTQSTVQEGIVQTVYDAEDTYFGYLTNNGTNLVISNLSSLNHYEFVRE